ncbi:hypothetical protein ACFLWA_01830, partial [Chloroflexota bacterium]
RRKLKYFVTPQGLAVKARLTSEYMEASLRLYRRLRRRAGQVVGDLVEAGYRVVNLDGDGDAAEIFRLTCIEHGVQVSPSTGDGIPQVSIDGFEFVVIWPERVDRNGRFATAPAGEIGPQAVPEDAAGSASRVHAG